MSLLARRRAATALVAFALATAPLVRAVGGPAEDKATARELAKEGITAEGKGDCASAIERLERAEALFHAPPHLQYLARCYARLGRLVDATETWRRLTLEPLAGNAPQAFRDAVDEAKVTLPKLEPRLAHLTVRTGEPYAGLVVEVDGRPWPSAALDVARVIDPGEHVVRARANGRSERAETISLAEGKSGTVQVTLEPISSASTGASASTAPSVSSLTTAGPVPSAGPAPSPRPSPLRTAGFVTAGVGVLALAGGAWTAWTASARFSELDAACPERSSCRLADLDERKSTIRTLDAATRTLLLGGGLLVAAGVTLTLLAPSGKGPSRTSSDPGRTIALTAVGLDAGGHVSVSGTF